MDHTITGTPAETILHGALELSKNSWLLALQFPDRAQPSLYPIRGGDTEGLMAKLMAARDRWAKVSGKAPSIVLCYEAGYDAFWFRWFAFPVSTRRISGARTASATAWSVKGRLTSIASRACCSVKAFAAST